MCFASGFIRHRNCCDQAHLGPPRKTGYLKSEYDQHLRKIRRCSHYLRLVQQYFDQCFTTFVVKPCLLPTTYVHHECPMSSDLMVAESADALLMIVLFQSCADPWPFYFPQKLYCPKSSATFSYNLRLDAVITIIKTSSPYLDEYPSHLLFIFTIALIFRVKRYQKFYYYNFLLVLIIF